MRALFAAAVAIVFFGCGPEELAPNLRHTPDAKLLPLLHAHNDYEHPRPLLDALEQNFDSVEADLYFRDGDLVAMHDAGDAPKGALKALYLEPLKARIAEKGGSVHGDGKPFFLWLDLKEYSAPMGEVIVTQLAQYDFLTRFNDANVEGRAVTVILTGNDSGKEALVSLPAPRPFIRDSNVFDDDDPAADTRWGYYSLNWLTNVNWPEGKGEIPELERRRLEVLVDKIHERHRRVRFWSTPETPEFWSLAAELGVDFLGTDELVQLREHMDQSR